jgi:hypothetical protein
MFYLLYQKRMLSQRKRREGGSRRQANLLPPLLLNLYLFQMNRLMLRSSDLLEENLSFLLGKMIATVMMMGSKPITPLPVLWLA